MRTIAQLADLRGVPMVPHSWSTGIIKAASLHVIGAMPNATFFEYCVQETALNQLLTVERFPVVDGMVALPETTGPRASRSTTTSSVATPWRRSHQKERAMGIYDELGLRTVINASGTLTRLGGSRMAPEVLAAMAEAAASFVPIDALQARAGEIIAEVTGAEAGYVVTGAAAGLSWGSPPASPGWTWRPWTACRTPPD